MFLNRYFITNTNIPTIEAREVDINVMRTVSERWNLEKSKKHREPFIPDRKSKNITTKVKVDKKIKVNLAYRFRSSRSCFLFANISSAKLSLNRFVFVSNWFPDTFLVRSISSSKFIFISISSKKLLSSSTSGALIFLKLL